MFCPGQGGGERADGASIGLPKVAIGKAEGMLLIGPSLRKLGEMAVERPRFFAALNATFDGSPIPVADGALIGAGGIGGDTSDKDDACAIASLEAADLFAA